MQFDVLVHDPSDPGMSAVGPRNAIMGQRNGSYIRQHTRCRRHLGGAGGGEDSMRPVGWRRWRWRRLWCSAGAGGGAGGTGPAGIGAGMGSSGGAEHGLVEPTSDWPSRIGLAFR